MTDDRILIEAAKLCGWDDERIDILRHQYFNNDTFRALCDMLEQHEFTKAAHAATIEGVLKSHEAFRQEVSDAVYAYVNATGGGVDEWENLKSLIIPKPDPLVEVMEQIPTSALTPTFVYAAKIRAALEARGLEIREKGQ